jgi:nucleobase transporter 1/2
MCEAPAPPVHMINRGILIEGIGCILAAIWGSGNGTNTFGENVGAIGVTKIGSRRVIQWAAVIMMIQGVFGKFGALFIIVPDPVVGGMFMIMFGMITAFGISALQHVDLKSARNLYIIGVSLFVPLVVCPWMQEHPGYISTGIDTIDSTLSVLLGTSILVGGALGCILDHSIPGTDIERGIIGWRKEISLDVGNSEETKCYDIPYVMNFLKKFKISYHLPFLPTYGRKRE